MALRGWRNLIADSPPVLKGRITDGEHHALFAQGGLFVLGKILSLESFYPVIGTPARNSITVRQLPKLRFAIITLKMFLDDKSFHCLTIHSRSAITPAHKGRGCRNRCCLIMKVKKLRFWNIVSVVALSVLTARLYVYSVFLLSLWLLKRNKIRMCETTARRSRQPIR